MPQKSITNRIDKIIDTVEHLAKGDYSVHFEVSGKNDEFDLISSSMNNMVDNVKKRIAENKKVEETLIRSEEQYRTLFDNAEVGMYRSTIDGSKVLAVNQKVAEILGITKKEILSNPAFIRWESKADRDDMIRKLKEDGYVRDYEMRVKAAGDEIKTLLLSGNMMQEKGWFEGTLLDITDRKRAEEEIAAQRQKLDYILQGTNVGTWEWNVQTKETAFNERWAEIIGYTLEEISPVSIDTWIKYAHPDDLKMSNELLNKHFNGKMDYYECEARMRHKNGSWIWVLDRGKVAIWADDGKPVLMCGTHTDVTLKKNAEIENQRLLNELREALDQVKVLSGFLPICSACKKIRDDKGYWNQIENYIRDHSEAEFSHSLCPDCAKELYPDIVIKKTKDT